MPTALTVVLTVILLIAAAIWIGGYCTVAVVAIISSRTLEPEARVRFFQRFGRAYFRFAGAALAVIYAVGWTLLSRTDWSGEHTRMLVASILLLFVLGAGIVQARDLTRRRARLALAPEDGALASSIHIRARAALILRIMIGVLSLGLLVHAAVLLADHGG